MNAKKIIDREAKLRGQRSNWESHWEEIALRVLPRHSEIFQTENFRSTNGQKKTEEMFDSSAAIALERFAAVMESMLTPMHQTWHRIMPTDRSLMRDRATALWFEDANRVLWMERKRSSANFQSQQFESYMSLGAFGTGAKFIDHNPNGGLRYRANHLSEVVFDCNHQGIIDTAYRKFKMTLRQVMQKYEAGLFQNVSEKVREKAEKNPDEEIDVVHCVRPREEVDPERADYRGMPFASYYVDKTNSVTMDEGGYETFPYAISRYVTAPGEIYGRSPAMTALPAIKVLNEQKKTMLKQGHRVVDPVLLAHDDGVLDTFSLKPGAINMGGVSKEGRALVQALPTGNIAAGQELMEMEKRVINDVFLVSVFQVLIERRGQTPPTATEVLELAKEKGSLLSPTMGRQQSEDLGPTIEREVDILMAQDKLPELTPAMIEAEADFEVEYESPLSRAQRAEEASGLFRSIEFATAHANVTQDPSAFDWIDIDKAMPAVMEINGVPASWQKSMDDVLALRENRNQQQQVQQMIEAAPAAAGIMKAVGPGL